MTETQTTEESAISEDVLLPPSNEQVDAISFLVKGIINKEKVMAFVAPGGSGKTFSLKHIAKDSRLLGIPMTFTATTNKAAVVMRKEKLKGAKTLHAAISKHVSTLMFNNIINMYKAFHKEPDAEITFSQDVLEFLDEIDVPEKEFFDYKNEKELLAENKIDSYDDRVFSHYSTLGYQGGVVWVDEGSMLPTKSQYQKDTGKDGNLKLKTIGRDILEKIYDTVIIVGDDSQLPPINGSSSFEGIPKVTLVENHRAEKSLLRLLKCARAGDNLANFEPLPDENVKIIASASDEYFDRESLINNKVTHIVYKNVTRKNITKQVRAGLSSEPEQFEPIVYKGANIDNPNDRISKNETGFFNGMMGEWDEHTQVVSGRNFDEYGTGFTYLQYAYAITAHTSQGSSFDYVVVHMDDIPHFIDKETRRKWIYTAVSRARKGIVIIY